ncbi:MAG TPA: c-type cytochrome [Candidatus Acidoferrum sp.]|nr:c-type cytochrome [Candidatus Acidoferrum sp.]
MRLIVGRNLGLFLTVLVVACPAGFAQSQGKKVEKAPIAQTSPASGKEMFKTYCAPCHGTSAKGDGPAAAELKVPPPDLTELAKRHEGKFPADYVTSVLRNGVKAPAHGSSEMPVWGPLFASVSGRDPAVVNMRIANLVRFLESVQEK